VFNSIPVANTDINTRAFGTFTNRRMSVQAQSDCIDIKLNTRPQTSASLDALAGDSVELTERTKWELY
jgi:hypothetical protein